MTVKYGFYDSLNGDRLYNANDINTFFEGVFSDGVFESVGGALAVENSPGTMNVLVNTGRAWFNNLWIRNTSTLTLTVEPSHMVFDRIDYVVLEFDSSITVRENSIKILKGTAAIIPIPPILANTSTLKQYKIAEIHVEASATEILETDITNTVGTVGTPYATSLVSGPESTAVNDFQVGNGIGGWIKKTLEEVKTIIGFYAHSHSTGDGAQIEFASLSGIGNVVSKNSEGDILIGKNYNSIADDEFFTVPLDNVSSLFMFIVQMRSGSTSTNWALGSCKAQASSVCEAYVKGTNTDTTTGPLTGTTGIDGRLTVSVHTDGNLYVENRTGARRNFTVKIW
jgi:hypothetical protein